MATFADGLLASFILPFGPLLLLSHLELAANGPDSAGDLQEEGQGNALGGEVSMHWAVVAKLWSQVCKEEEGLHGCGCFDGCKILLQQRRRCVVGFTK